MYICLECLKIFEEPIDCYGDWLEHFGTPCREEVSGSPCCEADYEEAHECDICGEYIAGDYVLVSNGDYICEDCYSTYSVGE